MNYFYVDGKPLHESEMFGDRFHKGLGVIWGNGDRYLVVDTWFSVDHHGHFDDGLHIFMEKVWDRNDDLPKKLAPEYFADGNYTSRKW
ncbi:MAG TPA: hypothetical protein VHZ02_06940 [Acidimicrobiales bacterium]|jgi:hypothetical protein|nr:hypothetical protein [Acidimicrobiales bacterium]